MTVAGIENSTINFIFKDKILIEAQYVFPNYDDESDSDAEYSKLLSGLTNKYGDPLGYTDGETDWIVSGVFKFANLYIEVSEAYGSTGEIRIMDGACHREKSVNNKDSACHRENDVCGIFINNAIRKSIFLSINMAQTGCFVM